MKDRGVVVIAVLTALACTNALAQVVSKCPDGKGGHVYQDAPCVHGQSTKDWDATPAYIAPERRAQINAERRRHEMASQRRAAETSSRSAATYAPSGPSASQQQSSRCASARAHRNAVLESVGLRRTYDLIRQLNDQVNRACAR